MASINVASLSKRKAEEPSKYVAMKKICKRCKQSNVKFKFLNNKKEDQPRYLCQDCTLVLGKPYHFNPFPIREYNHGHGYAKLPKVETEELKNLKKVCNYCQAENNATFRGYNNGKVNQPRYVCNVCKRLFSPLKNSKAISTKIDASLSKFQTTKAQYQEVEASQQPNEIDVSSSEFQTTEAHYQEVGALQQLNEIGVPSYKFQTIEAQYQEAGASQQPNEIDVSSSKFQSPKAQYQEARVLEQPLPHNNSYEQTSNSYQQYNYYNTYCQSSDNHSTPTMDIDGSSNQFPFSSQNVETWQWQQPLLSDTSFDQTTILSQQHSYPHLHNQGSDNHYLASVDVDGSTNQFPWQQSSLYNPLDQQTSIMFEQYTYQQNHPQNQSNNDYPCALNIGSTPPSRHPPLQSNPILPLDLSDVQTSNRGQENDSDLMNFQENDSDLTNFWTNFVIP